MKRTFVFLQKNRNWKWIKDDKGKFILGVGLFIDGAPQNGSKGMSNITCRILNLRDDSLFDQIWVCGTDEGEKGEYIRRYIQDNENVIKELQDKPTVIGDHTFYFRFFPNADNSMMSTLFGLSNGAIIFHFIFEIYNFPIV